MSLIDTIRNNPGVIENQIVAAFLASKKFFYDYSESIRNLSKVLGSRQSKFTNHKNRILFDCICEFRDNTTENALPRTFADDFITTCMSEGKLLPDEATGFPTHLDDLYNRATTATVDFIEGEVFETWFDSGLVSDIVSLTQSSEYEVSLDDLSEKITRIKIAKARKEKNSFTFVESMVNEREQAALIPSGIPMLDANLGGGFRCGESTVVAATTGGGKTVLACQLAGQFANTGRKVIFVTTEERPNALTPRFLSNQCDIPFSLFTKNVSTGSSVVPPEVSNVRKYNLKILNTLGSLNEHIRFLDWSDGSGKSVEKDLDAAIEAIMADPEAPFPAEVIIFDWLGGALKKDANKDLRIMFLDGAEHLHNMAKRLSMSVILFAQLNKVKASNKSRCDSSMLAECTSIPDKASNAIYISSVLNEDKSGISLLQKLNVDKARKGPGGTVPILRDFGFQRFVSPTATNSL